MTPENRLFPNAKVLEKGIQDIFNPDVACNTSDGLGSVTKFFSSNYNVLWG
jgi:hypothetical protein